MTADKGNLKPVPAAGQNVVEMKEQHFVEETKNGIKVVAKGYATGEVFTATVGVENHTESSIPLEQERFFAFNAYDRTLYRVPDYEVRAALARAAEQPPPPPPPPRHYYTLNADTYGNYTLHYEGDGYYGVNGYSQTYGKIEEHYDRDPAETLGYVVGAAIGQAIQRHTFRKAIEEVDKTYFRNTDLAPNQFAVGSVIFDARKFSVSPRAPFKLIVFIADTKFQFMFQQ